MKQKLTALFAALALCLTLVGCSISTPANIGRIGDVIVPSGIYLLYQHSAYQSAASYATEDQDPNNVSAFLKQTITPGADAEPQTVSSYVADRTLDGIRLYAAVETRFTALGGALTAEQQAAADSYAQQLVDNDDGTYSSNGIGLSTLKLYERNLVKQGLLMDMIFGAEGEQPVPEETLVNYLSGDLVYGYYTVVPLYNPSTYTFATDEQKAEMLSQAETAIQLYEASLENFGEALDADTRISVFYSVLTNTLPGIYSVLDGEYDVNMLTDDFYDDIFPQSQLEAYFSPEAAAALQQTPKGSAAAVQYTELGMLMFLRLDPLDVYTLDDLRNEALTQLKSEDLTADITTLGEQLYHALDTDAMSKLPASRIVMR